MSKTLALLSGKGGSGKTTLGLSMASLLSSCEVKVLLVDCDLSTNGATYFYENKLSEVKGELLSFGKILKENLGETEVFVEINDCFDFIPSITRITKEITETYTYGEKGRYFINKFIQFFSNEYDVILFDCQAGYTDVLKAILPNVDESLVVMEADAISSAALRSLYLKIGDIVRDKKVYQIFNKVAKEEYDIYSRLSGGTVFTNIETVRFDWKIRKAFSIAQIPDMENTSANYGEQIYNICNILFPENDVQEKLKRYKIILEIHKNNELIANTHEIIGKIAEKQNTTHSKTTRFLYKIFIPMMAVVTAITFFTMIEEKIFTYSKEMVSAIVPLVIALITSLSVAWVGLWEQTKERRNNNHELNRYNMQLEEALEKSKKLKAGLEKIQQKETLEKKS